MKSTNTNMDHKISAFDRAARYLSVQARCEAEVRRYLKGKDYGEAEIEEAVKKLQEYDYLDDDAYCQSYYRQAVLRHKGRRRIESELVNKGVARSVIQAAIDAVIEEEGEDEPILFDERERAMEVGRKMARQQALDGKALDEKFLARIGRRLASLGYSADTVYYVVGALRGTKERWSYD